MFLLSSGNLRLSATFLRDANRPLAPKTARITAGSAIMGIST